MLEINYIFNIRKIPLNTTPSYGSVSIGFDATVTSVHGGAVHLSSSTLGHAVVPRQAALTSRAARGCAWVGLRCRKKLMVERMWWRLWYMKICGNGNTWMQLMFTFTAQLTSRVSSSGFLTASFTVSIATSSIPTQASTRGTTRSWRMSDILHSR
jgi:hypothetical protein